MKNLGHNAYDLIFDELNVNELKVVSEIFPKIVNDYFRRKIDNGVNLIDLYLNSSRYHEYCSQINRLINGKYIIDSVNDKYNFRQSGYYNSSEYFQHIRCCKICKIIFTQNFREQSLYSTNYIVCNNKREHSSNRDENIFCKNCIVLADNMVHCKFCNEWMCVYSSCRYTCEICKKYSCVNCFEKNFHPLPYCGKVKKCTSKGISTFYYYSDRWFVCKNCSNSCHYCKEKLCDCKLNVISDGVFTCDSCKDKLKV